MYIPLCMFNNSYITTYYYYRALGFLNILYNRLTFKLSLLAQLIIDSVCIVTWHSLSDYLSFCSYSVSQSWYWYFLVFLSLSLNRFRLHCLPGTHFSLFSVCDPQSIKTLLLLSLGNSRINNWHSKCCKSGQIGQVSTTANATRLQMSAPQN